MAVDKSTTIRFRTLAEIGNLRQYTAALREYRNELTALTRAVEGYNRGAGGGGGGAPGAGASQGAPPPPPRPSGPSQDPSEAPTVVDGAPPGGEAGTGAPPPVRAPKPSSGGMVSSLAQGAMSLGAKGLAVGAGLALGGGLLSFFTSRANQYMQLSSVVAQLNRRFREGEGAVAGWGRALAFTTGQTASMMDVLGQQVNDPSKETFTSFAGVARNYGMNPSAAMASLGGLERRTGGLGRQGLAQVIGRAVQQGMDGGRLAEHIRSIASISEETFRRTGKSDITGTLATQGIPGLIFGAGDSRAQGQASVEFMARLNAGAGNPAMQTLLMREMGFGQEGGPGYIEMRKRLDAGFYGESGVRNLAALGSAFQRRGADTTYAFRALEGVMPGLKSHELEALSRFLTNPEMSGMLGKLSGVQDLDAFYGSLSEKERKAFDESGFAGMAGLGGRAGAGDWRQVQMEGLSMRYGPAMAETMMKLTDTGDQVLQMLGNLSGIDWATTLTDLVTGINNLSKNLNRWSQRGSLAEQGGQFYGQLFSDMANNVTQASAGNRDYGSYEAMLYSMMQMTPQGRSALLMLEKAGVDGAFSDTTAARYAGSAEGGSE